MSMQDVQERVQELQDELDMRSARSDAAHDAQREAVMRLDGRVSDLLAAVERERRGAAATWDALAEHTRVRERVQTEWQTETSERLERIASRLDTAESQIRLVLRAALLGGGGGAAVVQVMRALWDALGGG